MHQIDTWIESLPEPLNETGQHVREMIFETVNGVEERYSYKLPVYHYVGLFCFLRHNTQLKALDVTFMRGKDLTAIFPQLEMRGRAAGGSIVLSRPADIVKLQLKEILITAAAWQQEAKQLKIPLVKKRRSGK